MTQDSAIPANYNTVMPYLIIENASKFLSFKKAIQAGAKVINEVTDQPYGRSGGVADPFGNTWWVTSKK